MAKTDSAEISWRHSHTKYTKSSSFYSQQCLAGNELSDMTWSETRGRERKKRKETGNEGHRRRHQEPGEEEGICLPVQPLMGILIARRRSKDGMHCSYATAHPSIYFCFHVVMTLRRATRCEAKLRGVRDAPRGDAFPFPFLSLIVGGIGR